MLTNQASQKSAQITAGELQLRLFGAFLGHHKNELNKLTASDTNQNYYCQTANIETLELVPIQIEFDICNEKLTNYELINSNNQFFNKIILVFASLCEEAEELSKQAIHYQFKLMYYDDYLTTDYQDVPSGGSQQVIITKTSEILEFLCNLQYFLQRCQIIADNIIEQLGALFSISKTDVNCVSPMHFQSVFSYFADLSLIFVIFEQILKRSNLILYWETFFTNVISMYGEEHTKEISYDDFEAVSMMLGKLEKLFTEDLFQNFIDSIYMIINKLNINVSNILATQFIDYIIYLQGEVGKYSEILCDFIEPPHIIKLNVMNVLNIYFFGLSNQRSLKFLNEINKKYIAITLVENILWCPDEFIKKYAPSEHRIHIKYLTESPMGRQNYLQSKTSTLTKETNQFAIAATRLIIALRDDRLQQSTNIQAAEIRHSCLLIEQSLQIVGQMSFLIGSMTNLHIHQKTSMSQETLSNICKLIEFMHVFNIAFTENSQYMTRCLQNSCQQMTHDVMFFIDKAKQKLTKQLSTAKSRNVDIVSAFELINRCLFGASTHQRLLITRLALGLVEPTRLFSSEDFRSVIQLLGRIEEKIQISSYVQKVCDTTFMYWHQTMLPNYLKQVLDQGVDYLKLKYVIHSADVGKRFADVINTDNFATNIELYTKTNEKTMHDAIISDTSNQIESDLRLDVHGNIRSNELMLSMPKKDIRELIKLHPLQIAGRHLLIKDHIEHHLSTVFYNLTTVALHDWRTYGEMRSLGIEKYDLDTVEDHLPTQTLEQGLDVLEIMRNIHVMVSKYLYNLNNQIFIEQSSNNKHLNTINIVHIANSLRTHGTGIINTTVNFTYQFLRKKFAIFSQFMYDEQIKSRLMKDLKYVRDVMPEQNHAYTFERAENFCRAIRALGLSPTGYSYIDLFRQLISHIGNAMGYVRLMRTGAMHCGSNATTFLPNLDADLVTFKDGLSGVISDAAINLEAEIKNLTSGSVDKIEYFRLFVDAFAPFFRNTQNIHLKYFYLIIPPLTLNFVEYMLMTKDKMTKKNKNESAFTDDGFAMGLAYILRLLNQMHDFNSLHWFNAVRQKYNNDKCKVTEELKSVMSQDDEKLQQTMVLTEKRINAYIEEFNLLYCNISSAKVFFQ